MKYLWLIWSGIWRNRLRTILVILQVSVAFALFGELQGMKTGIDNALANTRADLLLVTSRVSLADALPLSYLERIRSVPGVSAVSIQNFLIATYHSPTQIIPVIASNPDQAWLKATPKFVIAPAQFAAMANTRTGALIGAGLARKYGWKIGDRLPLNSGTLKSDGSRNWAFDVVGIFTYSEVLSTGDFILVNNTYFDEARLLGKGTARFYSVVTSDPGKAVVVADTIDRMFANSAHETSTGSVRELAQSQLQSIGDLNFVIRAIIGVVFLALLLSTTAMMMQSIQERTSDLAVLKACGFTDRSVFMLVLVEAMAVCVAAAALGLAMASATFVVASRSLPGLSMPAGVVGAGFGIALLVAFISAALPAFRAARLQVVDALAGR